MPIRDNEREEAPMANKAFIELAIKNFISLEDENDWGVWWDFFYSGYTLGLEVA